jgi:tetratricopeptide (TPR) repeat protein
MFNIIPVPFIAIILLCFSETALPAVAFEKTYSVHSRSEKTTVPSDTNRIDTLLKYLDKNRFFLEPEKLISIAYDAARLSDSLISIYSPKYKSAAKNRKASALMHISMLKATTGELKQAHECIQQAIGYFKETRHERGLAKAYGNLATLYVMYGDFVPGLKYQLMSLKLLEELKDSNSIASCYFNMAITYLETKDYTSAKKYVLRSMHIREQLGQKTPQIDCLSLLGGIYFQNKESALALKTLKKALAESKKFNYELMQGEILANMANVYADKKNYDSAVYYYEAAKEIQSKFSDGMSVTRSTASLGFVYTESGNFKKGKKFLLVAIDSLKRFTDDRLLETVYDKLVECDSALGDKDEAIFYSRLAKEVGIRNSAGETKDKLSELQHEYEVDKKERENQRLNDKTKIQELEIYRSKLIVVTLVAVIVFTLLTFLLLYRQQKLKAINNSIELEQRLLRSQMNPHFIFNALQAIQNFARKNDTEKLLKYLDSFATLTRDVLENSRVEQISLAREIILLENYLSVQKLRFGNRFEYQIHVAEGLLTTSVLLPPMLSQPFIENAIEHGFSEMEEGGRLDVYFKEEGDFLVMEIVDNGMGLRKNAAHEDEHTSLAIAITRERIDLLNKKNRHKSEFKISDADPSRSSAKGVRVSFKIPLTRV